MKKVIILPLDGYKNGDQLLEVLRKILKEPEIKELLAFVKINDGVHNIDYGGPTIYLKIEELLKEHGVDAKIFLDLKIFDVSETLKNVLRKYLLWPGILTVSSNCSAKGILELRRSLPETKLAMVSALTDMPSEECQSRFGMSPAVKIYNDLMNINREYKKISQAGDAKEPFDLIVCSYYELNFLSNNLSSHYGYIVPGIRDAWMKKSDEHQKRTIGVLEALQEGATYVVMGAQMTKGNPELSISPEESRKRTIEEIRKFQEMEINPLLILRKLDGYYCSPKNADGSLIGPLVAYAGTYEDENGQKKNYVGAEYFNFARIDENSRARFEIARFLAQKLFDFKEEISLIIGAPMGGLFLAAELGQFLDLRTIFAEKKIIALADPSQGKKEQSELDVQRYEINDGDNVVIVEDVCNNFSTTEKMQKLIEQKGGKLVAIVCAFNRSGKETWNDIPVVSACFIPTKQWKQDEPEVAGLIAAGKIVWKPKLEWEKLKEAMKP